MTRDEGLKTMGLPLDASEAAIKRRFKDLAFGVGGPGCHPDKGGTAEAFARLTIAYHAARSIPVTEKQAKTFIRRDTLGDVVEIAAVVAEGMNKPTAARILRDIFTKLSQKG